MNAKLDEIRSLIDRQQMIIHVLLSEQHPQLDRLAQSMALSVQQTRSIIESNHDKKLLSKIRAGYVQGWRELPELLASMRDVDEGRLISKISALGCGFKS